MKVKPNDLSVPTYYGKGVAVEGGIPIRLEIAARLLGGFMGRPDFIPSEKDRDKNCKGALIYADALIKAHNETADQND